MKAFIASVLILVALAVLFAALGRARPVATCDATGAIAVAVSQAKRGC